MIQTFTARVFQEGDWFVAQCLEIEIASQGKSQTEALNNLQEAIELHYEYPIATVLPKLEKLEIKIDAA
jgi:predicted RNase H-like HicB family nuclease